MVRCHGRRLSSSKIREDQVWPETPPIWQRRFYDVNVWSESKRVGKLRYMH
jgi:hypothetical protein